MIMLHDSEATLQRVRHHLERHYFSASLPEGSKLPPVRSIARDLGVSTAAVYAIYRQFQDEGRVVSVVGRGTFIAPGNHLRQKMHIAVSMAISPDSSDQWRNSLIASLLEAAATHPELTVRPLGATHLEHCESSPDALRAEIARIDGLILLPMLPISRMNRVTQICNEEGKPIVYMNSPAPFQTANFVSSDYYQFGVTLGQTWLESGRHNLLLMGGMPDAASWVQRLAGFQTAAGRDEHRLRVCYAGSLAREAGYRATKELLASGYRPDAVFAFGDALAIGVWEALREAGFSIPGEVSIVGGTGMDSTHQLGISTHSNNYAAIGREALEMISTRIRNGGEPVPARYIPIGFHPAGTTRPLEHTLWKQFNTAPTL